jgi:hypothetical protein
MMIIYFKDNLSFIYITMDALRKEIDDEIKRTRLDKTRLYDLLSKIIDQCGGPVGEGSVGPMGPPGPAGPAGPPGPPGPGASVPVEAKSVAKKAAPKKKAASTA